MNVSTPAPTTARTNGAMRSASGITTTTTIGPTPPAAISPRPHASTPASTTSRPTTSSQGTLPGPASCEALVRAPAIPDRGRWRPVHSTSRQRPYCVGASGRRGVGASGRRGVGASRRRGDGRRSAAVGPRGRRRGDGRRSEARGACGAGAAGRRSARRTLAVGAAGFRAELLTGLALQLPAVGPQLPELGVLDAQRPRIELRVQALLLLLTVVLQCLQGRHREDRKS